MYFHWFDLIVRIIHLYGIFNGKLHSFVKCQPCRKVYNATGVLEELLFLLCTVYSLPKDTIFKRVLKPLTSYRSAPSSDIACPLNRKIIKCLFSGRLRPLRQT